MRKGIARKGKATAISKEYRPKAGRFYLLRLDYYESHFEGKGLKRSGGTVMFYIDM